MFNSELKKRFIEQYSNSEKSHKSYVALFNSVSEFEDKFGMDICCMDITTLQEIVDSLFGVGLKSRITKFAVIRDYVRWCIAIGVDGANDSIMHIDICGIERMKKMTVSCPLALNEFLNALYDPESKRTLDNTYRCFLWLAYAGMNEADALKVKTTHVNFDLLTIEYYGRSYPIYPESIQAFRLCVKLKEFYYDHPNYGDDVVVYKKRVPGSLLLRGVKSQPQSSAFRTELNKRNKAHLLNGDTCYNLSYKRVWLSGVFYRMYTREMAGFPVDFDGFVYELKNNGMISPSIGVNAAKNKARNYLIDYERWKLTFK